MAQGRKKGALGQIWVPGTGFVDSSLSLGELARKIGNGRAGLSLVREHEARRIQLVNAAEIVRDIDELFELHGSDD